MTTAPRKLATIVALDVAGYSARTEADEARTTSEVAALRGVIEGIAARHAGRVFNTAGDGFMLEFGSSLAAVEAAFELAEKCEPKVRVGVHLGDVVVQPNGDLLGHGVNVAARLMARSEPGGALISADVRRTIRGQLADRLVSRGLMQLDKMSETIEAFALAAVASVIVAAPAKSAEPLLAVLPFDNLSNDPDMQFFSDGVSEEILQVLASGTGLRVIGRTSAFQFRGTSKGEAAQKLRATHILDGAVRRSGSRLRVNAQLMEAGGGAALWSERYDQDLIDIFTVQDDIAAKVANALRSVLLPAPLHRQIDPHAYELYLRAIHERSSATDEAERRAEVLLEEVVARAPDFVRGWALLGTMRARLLPRDRDGVGTPEYNAALAATQRALALDPNCGTAYWNLTNLKPAFAEHAEKIALAQRAVEFAPNSPAMLINRGGTQIVVGRCQDALADQRRAASLEPLNPFWASAVARLLEGLGNEQDAHNHLDEAVALQGTSLWTATTKFGILFNASRFAEAAAYFDGSILSRHEEFSRQCRFLLGLPSLTLDQSRAVFRNLLASDQEGVLSLMECELAARFGCADLAYDCLFGALDAARPIAGWRSRAIGIPRAVILAYIFSADGTAFRADKRFPRFCARVGLVDYWTMSGRWPDCAVEVPYDFKAECEKAAREVAKA
ncbi:MAG: hypothetical protein KBA31_22530 [Alphaproteobacteria bacterium]|nr:hypothetical protein [Alphaproteobacteria bacterium]